MSKAKLTMTWDDLPQSGLIAILGHRGEGKTALAWYLGERAHQARRPVAAYGIVNGARRYLPGWVKHVATVSEVAKLPPAVIVADEAAFIANARRSSSAGNVEWVKLLAVTRHKGHLLLFITQQARQLDVGLVSDADLIILKRPSLLHLRFSRPELRPELEDAFARFEKVRGDTRAWSLIVDYHFGRKGWLENPLPSFWSERLSRAFAAIDLSEEGAAA